MKTYKRVPALDKCFFILDLLAKNQKTMGISEIARDLKLNKSSVFNIVHTLADLHVLEEDRENRFGLGTLLFTLGRAERKSSDLIRLVRPILEDINRKTGLSAFLGIRSGMRAVILDKVDSAFDIRISAEVGMRLSLLAGAGGKALLSQLSDKELDKILKENLLKRFTPHTCTQKGIFRKMIQEVREQGIAFDREEYIEGICAFAIPLQVKTRNLQAAIWAAGLKGHFKEELIGPYFEHLRRVVRDVEERLVD